MSTTVSEQKNMEIVSQNAAAQSATVAGSAQLRFELATSADLDEIVNVNSAAFFDYPTFEAIFQQPIVEQYRAALHWLFTRIIRGVVSRGNPILLAKDPETNRILSSAVLVYPESRLNTWDMIKGGIAAFPFVWGFRPLMRLLEADRKCSRDVVDVKAGDIELFLLAVSPDCQGRGIGGALVDRLLATVVHEYVTARAHETGSVGKTSRRVVLTTHKPQNNRFFEKHGFKTEKNEDVLVSGSKEYVYPMWMMSYKVDA